MNSQLSKFIYSPTDALVSGLKKPILKFTAPTCFGAVTPSSRSVLMRILYRILYLPLYFVSLRMAPSEPKHVRDNTTYFIMNVFSCILLTNSKIIHGQGKILNLGYVPSITAIFAMWRLVIHFSKQNIVGLCIWSFLLAHCRHLYWITRLTPAMTLSWQPLRLVFIQCSHKWVTWQSSCGIYINGFCAFGNV